MTREEAVNVLRNTWLNAGRVNGKTVFAEALNMAIKALETQPDGDAVSRKDAIRIVDSIDTWQAGWRGNAIESLKALPSAQPDITPDGTLNISIDADVASVGRILLSQTGTQRGGLYYKDEQPEIIRCQDCKHYIKSESYCDYLGITISDLDFCSRAERRTDGVDS